jgi:hypothetical protein
MFPSVRMRIVQNISPRVQPKLCHIMSVVPMMPLPPCNWIRRIKGGCDHQRASCGFSIHIDRKIEMLPPRFDV